VRLSGVGGLVGIVSVGLVAGRLGEGFVFAAPPDKTPEKAGSGEKAGANAPMEKGAKLPPVVDEPLPPRARLLSAKHTRNALLDFVLETQNRSQAIARKYVQLLLSERYDEANHLHDEVGGRKLEWPQLLQQVEAWTGEHGQPKEIVQYLTASVGAEVQTFFFAAAYKDGTELAARVTVDHYGHVVGAAIGGEVVPAAKKRYDRHDTYQTKTELSLPFKGVWTATNATPGSNNGHYLNPNQRFAVDFQISVDVENGKRSNHQGDGSKNADYYAYGQDILAPADGVVVAVVDGVPENPPGLTDIYYRFGNAITISFGNGEYGLLAHLVPGSAKVRVGDRVKRGQAVARCGNSGNSTAPHLHFQLSDSPTLSVAASLPIQFAKVRRHNTVENRVQPLTGDRLSNPDTETAPEHKATATKTEKK
jgi:murein DD-endopeptidase MepM/ murein hydrolase activator NlpD